MFDRRCEADPFELLVPAPLPESSGPAAALALRHGDVEGRVEGSASGAQPDASGARLGALPPTSRPTVAAAAATPPRSDFSVELRSATRRWQSRGASAGATEGQRDAALPVVAESPMILVVDVDSLALRAGPAMALHRRWPILAVSQFGVDPTDPQRPACVRALREGG